MSPRRRLPRHDGRTGDTHSAFRKGCSDVGRKIIIVAAVSLRLCFLASSISIMDTTVMAFTVSSPFISQPASSSSGLGAATTIRGGNGSYSKNNNNNLDGLSRSFQSILSRTNNERQRFVTGQYPVIITVEENPTLKWLNLGKMNGKDISTAVVLVNGTTIDRSLASYDRYQWLEERERQELHDRYATVSMELLAEINLPKPGYLQVLPCDGAGSSAALLRNVADVTRARWNRWRRDALYHEMEDIELQEAPYRERLWVTGFSLASRRGLIKSVDINDGHIDTINSRSESMILWPNEVNKVPVNLLSTSVSKHAEHQQSQTRIRSTTRTTQDALLVSDGFLVPGKDRGGIYVVKNPGNENSEWSICLTNPFTKNQWFYHRAVWVDLTGDGRQSILTARAKLRKVTNKNESANERNNYRQEISVDGSRPKNGQLVWLEMPKPHHFDEATGTPLEEDGTAFDPFSARHLPWKERVLATGPDVMFAVADIDSDDDTIEVLASQFFDKKVTLHSIQRGSKPYVSFTRVIDDRCGAAFGGILADLDSSSTCKANRVIDSGSTVNSLSPGDSFSHFLVTSHECDFDNDGKSGSVENQHFSRAHHQDKIASHGNDVSLRGGSLFAYRVPDGVDAWKSQPWRRTTVATGFQVKSQIWNVINPGAPGFCYTFHAHKDDNSKIKRPMIAVAGDCAESAYIFRPQQQTSDDRRNNKKRYNNDDSGIDNDAQYKLMCEIKCGATVGSIAIGYGDLCSAEQESGYAKIYVPCFEKDKILVFALGSGAEGGQDDSGW